jgi:Xaa-Pro aminopeptidase
MFSAQDYQERRDRLVEALEGGLVLLPGNEETAMNYEHNTYPFRQDSTFLYYFGIDRPGLAVVLDVDSGETILFGNEPTLEETVWTGPQPTLEELGAQTGIQTVDTLDHLSAYLNHATSKDRKIHFLPPYRDSILFKLASWLGINPENVARMVSKELIQAVVRQRSRKSKAELKEIESALVVTREMHLMAMDQTHPGMKEAVVAGRMEGLARSKGTLLAYPVIFTTRGEVLHNVRHDNTMNRGDLILNDSGAESAGHYASDITRTFPVSGSFSTIQRECYELVLAMQTTAIKRCRPGISYRDVHLAACRVLVEGLMDLGLMKGNSDEALAAGAHTLFFPHGLGHMLGLDVHDMENLGEDYVGYDEEVTRSTEFGLEVLRFGRKLEQGFVVTVEPGLYFIPALIDRWQAEGRGKNFIVFERLESFRTFGGIRIEDDIVITSSGCRVLGPPIPKTVEEIESRMAA